MVLPWWDTYDKTHSAIGGGQRQHHRICPGSFLILIMILSPTSNKNDAFGILQSTGTLWSCIFPAIDLLCQCNWWRICSLLRREHTMLDHGMIRTVKQMRNKGCPAPYLLFQKCTIRNFGTDISIGGIDTTSAATRTNVCAPTNIIAGKYLTGDPHEIVAEESFATAHTWFRLEIRSICSEAGWWCQGSSIRYQARQSRFLRSHRKCQRYSEEQASMSGRWIWHEHILVEVSDARDQDRVIGQLKKALTNSVFQVITVTNLPARLWQSSGKHLLFSPVHCDLPDHIFRKNPVVLIGGTVQGNRDS